MERWTFPIVPRATNELRGRHWGKKHDERRRWGKAVLGIPKGPFMVRRGALPPAARVRLVVTVYRWNKQDPDNCVASMKPLIDALVARGWLVDDSEKWLAWEFWEVCDRKNQRTEVEWSLLE